MWQALLSMPFTIISTALSGESAFEDLLQRGFVALMFIPESALMLIAIAPGNTAETQTFVWCKNLRGT
jgi:hypothetical protein